MKIGIFQDVHANLPALQKAIEVFRLNTCDKIIHVGDLIAIGPYPKETIDLAMSIKEMEFVIGNHDHYYGFGLPDPIPTYMKQNEIDHQNWTHQQIGSKYKESVSNWEFEINYDFATFKISFVHYGLNQEKNWFDTYVKEPNATNLDFLFKHNYADLIFYGHNHDASDISGRSRYVNLGSAGCFNKAEVRLGILEIKDNNYSLQKLSIPYLDQGYMEAFDIRQVPARDLIRQAFVTRG